MTITIENEVTETVEPACVMRVGPNESVLQAVESRLDQIEKAIASEIEHLAQSTGEQRTANQEAVFRALQKEYLSKNGHLDNVLRVLGRVPGEHRKSVGERCNIIVRRVNALNPSLVETRKP